MSLPVQSLDKGGGQR